MPGGRKVTGWRKLAGATWSAPRDPQFYGDLEIDVATAQSYVDDLRRTSGVHVTLTHLVVKAVAHGLRTVPALNVRLARGREYPRDSIDVFVIVAISNNELSGVKIQNADRKSVVEIARELADQTTRMREGDDPQLGRGKKMLAALPPSLLRVGLRLGALLTSDLNLDLPGIGLPRQAFGGAMVSAVGMTGVSHAYSPLAPYYRVPLLVLVGAVTEKPVALRGQVLARPILSVTATFDHRYADGLVAADFGKAAAEFLRDPSAFDAPRQRAAPTAGATVG